MSGIDLETIRQEGSWKSLRMVERYAAVSAAHRQRAMAKLKVTLGKARAIAITRAEKIMQINRLDLMPRSLTWKGSVVRSHYRPPFHQILRYDHPPRSRASASP